ncbi:unnamed protein product [Ceutorhynchus assimilis]|uniref:DUF7869 domain-containing protein n=1 Tax=Ceutorhynchus assimilis TaxID=467358 RepID=A0A9N9QIN0_9CUCU|nr:unnamed protein product [Ceutorhynchus assimilis]
MYKLYLEDDNEKDVPKRFKSDTCSTCDANSNTEEHESQYKFAFEQQKREKNHARVTENVCYVTMDLQQKQPLSKITTSKAFYLCQLWFYNLSIHSATKSREKPYFFTWTEDIAGKDSFEAGSSLHTFVQFLDSCSGQNKNFNMIALYQYLVLKGMFRVIDHKFREVGHSFLDSDRDFGMIEKNLRKRENILVPDQYREIIKSSSVKSAVVINMENASKIWSKLYHHFTWLTRKKTF